jgi:hypothetical protein
MKYITIRRNVGHAGQAGQMVFNRVYGEIDPKAFI